MPFRFRAERTIDDPTVQSIFYGPTLLAFANPPVGDDLEDGLLEVSFYHAMTLDGDLSPAMSPSDRPLHFTTGGRDLFPFFVADPGGGRTQPYHIYVRRHEPAVIFGSVEAGVVNPSRDDGLTFLDVVWDEAPFADHEALVSTVERTAAEWRDEGRFTERERAAVVAAAGRAEGMLGR